YSDVLTLRAPRHTLVPYTTLFRSPAGPDRSSAGRCAGRSAAADAGGRRPALRGAVSAGAARPHGRRRSVPGVFHTPAPDAPRVRSEEHTSELQSRENLVCRLLLVK